MCIIKWFLNKDCNFIQWIWLESEIDWVIEKLYEFIATISMADFFQKYDLANLYTRINTLINVDKCFDITITAYKINY